MLWKHTNLTTRASYVKKKHTHSIIGSALFNQGNSGLISMKFLKKAHRTNRQSTALFFYNKLSNFSNSKDWESLFFLVPIETRQKLTHTKIIIQRNRAFEMKPLTINNSYHIISMHTSNETIDNK